MNHLKHLLSLVVFLLALPFSLLAQDCSSVQAGGTFVYGNNRDMVVVIDGSNHTETYTNGYIKSTIAWTGDCTFTLTINEFTIPIDDFTVGDTVSVTIDSVDGDTIIFASTHQSRTWKSEMVKE